MTYVSSTKKKKTAFQSVVIDVKGNNTKSLMLEIDEQLNSLISSILNV